MTERRTTEADRLIAQALVDHLPPAPRRLRDRLEREHLRAPASRRGWVVAFAAGVAAAAAVRLLVLRPGSSDAPTSVDIAREAAGDHLRILVATKLDVVASDMHQVKPWFAGKLEFVPPVSFLGDDEFPLHGGQLAVFNGHKAAAFVYGRRLHVISLFVYPQAIDAHRAETTVQGFHVITWKNGDVGMALVSDVAWDDLRALEDKLR